MIENKIFGILIIFALVFSYGCCELFPPNPPDPYDPYNPPDDLTIEEQIEQKLENQGLNILDVTIAPDNSNIEVEYLESSEADENNVYATWGYIFGVMQEYAPSYYSGGEQTFTIICGFDNGEVLEITSNGENIYSFMNGDIDTWEFLYNLEIETINEIELDE